jgi:hypothetical protein
LNASPRRKRPTGHRAKTASLAVCGGVKLQSFGV